MHNVFSQSIVYSHQASHELFKYSKLLQSHAPNILYKALFIQLSKTQTFFTLKVLIVTFSITNMLLRTREVDTLASI